MPPSDFFLDVTFLSVGSEPLPVRKVRNELRGWLEAIDPDLVAAAFSATHDMDAVPMLSSRWNEWELQFRAIPRKKEARRKPGVRILGMSSPGIFSHVDHDRQILKVLAKKSSVYGQPELPYIIALLNLTDHPPDDSDHTDFFYGAGSTNGFWGTSEAPENAHITAVLTGVGLRPWNVTRSIPTLYTCPWPMHHLTEALPWPKVGINPTTGATYREEAETEIAKVLNLNQGSG
jgi:hypothetical protein